eukprot:Awhi_evm1s2917
MMKVRERKYLLKTYGERCEKLSFESIHCDHKVANSFETFLSSQFCLENFEIYEKILEYENMFGCCCPNKNAPEVQAEEDRVDTEEPSKTCICSHCIDKNQILKTINYIKKEFICKNSEREVNLTAKTKNQLLFQILVLSNRPKTKYGHWILYECDATLFEDVKAEVKVILEKDLFPRFIKNLHADVPLHGSLDLGTLLSKRLIAGKCESLHTEDEDTLDSLQLGHKRSLKKVNSNPIRFNTLIQTLQSQNNSLSTFSYDDANRTKLSNSNTKPHSTSNLLRKLSNSNNNSTPYLTKKFCNGSRELSSHLSNPSSVSSPSSPDNLDYLELDLEDVECGGFKERSMKKVRRLSNSSVFDILLSAKKPTKFQPLKRSNSISSLPTF